jgi:hypothetical protein
MSPEAAWAASGEHASTEPNEQYREDITQNAWGIPKTFPRWLPQLTDPAVVNSRFLGFPKSLDFGMPALQFPNCRQPTI